MEIYTDFRIFSSMLYWLGKWILWLGRWKIVGVVPDLKQYVIIVAPHTSNWDFVVAAAAKYYLHLDARFLGKAELFRPPFGGLFRAMGGYPVDRKKHNNVVDFVVSLFRENPVFSMGLSPEGTRKYVAEWKTGFYHIAFKAGVPIVMAGLDYPHRRLIISDPFHPTGDLAADMQVILAFFRPIKGRHPEQGMH
jgi:1-acyl-sn-glycerol-3-phosphate acyltransferase